MKFLSIVSVKSGVALFPLATAPQKVDFAFYGLDICYTQYPPDGGVVQEAYFGNHDTN